MCLSIEQFLSNSQASNKNRSPEPNQPRYPHGPRLHPAPRTLNPNQQSLPYISTPSAEILSSPSKKSSRSRPQDTLGPLTHLPTARSVLCYIHLSICFCFFSVDFFVPGDGCDDSVIFKLNRPNHRSSPQRLIYLCCFFIGGCCDEDKQAPSSESIEDTRWQNRTN